MSGAWAASLKWLCCLGIIASLGILGSACTDEGVSAAAGPAAVAKPSFGQRCDPSAGCEKPLQCIDSEYAPHPWCGASCDSSQLKNYCTAEQLGSAGAAGQQGLCVQMPAGFAGPQQPLCLPICSNLASCQALDPQWETCAQPSYKGLTFIKDLPTKVCQAPSAHGQNKVDPLTCDWAAKATDPSYADAKTLCKAICAGFLKSCQLWPKSQSADCCGWACFQYVTPGGIVSTVRLDSEIKCYIKAFTAYAQTPKVCEAYATECPPLPAVLNPPP